MAEAGALTAEITAHIETFADAARRCGLSMQEFAHAFNSLAVHLPAASRQEPEPPRRTGRRGIDLSGAVIRNND